MNELDIAVEPFQVVITHLLVAGWPVIPTSFAMRRADIRAYIETYLWNPVYKRRLVAAAAAAGYRLDCDEDLGWEAGLVGCKFVCVK